MSIASSIESKSAMGRVKQDVNQVRHDVAQTGHDIAQAARAGVAQTRDRVGEALSSARDRASDGVEDLQLRIMERPVTCVAIALGVGVLIGALVRRV